MRSKEISKKDHVIEELKTQLREIKTHAEESTRRMEYRSKQKEDLENTQYTSRESHLQIEIKTLVKKLEDIQIAHREEEAGMRKKKVKIENEVEAWIAKYDQEMEEKQNEIDELTAIYNEEHINLVDLQRRNEELSKEWQRILDERSRQEELKKQKEAELAQKNLFASKIQALWRGYVVRRDLKKKKKPEKKSARKK